LRPGKAPFPYHIYLDRLRQDEPAWPERTWDVSHFRIALTLRNLRSRHSRELLLEFVDYSGERLLDMPLLNKDFGLWSDDVVKEAEVGLKKELGATWLATCRGIAAEARAGDSEAAEAVAEYERYLSECRDRGLVYLQPASLLLQGGPAGSPGFCPLPREVRTRAPRLTHRFAALYDAYVREHVAPFFKATARCSRQVVLVDVLRVLRQGVDSYNDAHRSMRQVLDAYVYARARGRLSPMRLLDGLRPRIGRVAFVATKADQATRATRGNLRLLLESMVDQKRRDLLATLPHGPRITYCAANRSTEDARKQYEGRELSCLRGVREDGPDDKEGPWFPGEVPPDWPDDEWDPGLEQFSFPDFRPRRLPRRDGAVIRHINLDRVFHYLIEDLIP
jgi:predicted YcjX-like family ATPase